VPGPIDARPDRAAWWRDAVVYQIYIRSFADGNGDGIGDIADIREHLPYVRELGVDALWSHALVRLAHSRRGLRRC